MQTLAPNPNLSDPWSAWCNLIDTGDSQYVIDLDDLMEFVDTVVIVGDAASVSFELSLKQDALLIRNKEIEVKKAITWSRSSVGMMNPGMILPGVQQKLDDYIKSFIEDHHKANGLKNPFEKEKKDEISV